MYGPQIVACTSMIGHHDMRLSAGRQADNNHRGPMDKYIVTSKEIEAYEGVEKRHFLNDNARRRNKSLGDLTGLTAIGFHIVEVPPGHESTESHVHYFEEECVYILEGEGQATIGESTYTVGAGDFIGYRAGGAAHKLENSGAELLRCIVVGQRLDHDVADYPRLRKRIFRNKGLPWNLASLDDIEEPVAGRKV
jgi:uncharacterized cupin superfamily protein